VPEVEGPLALGQAWAAAREPFLLDRSGDRHLSELASTEALTLFVGPEGGWTADELAQAGERVLSLGQRNLRAETAALAALAVGIMGMPARIRGKTARR
jgi:16S rRNA (uracil1498-N3)-methyltransferase